MNDYKNTEIDEPLKQQLKAYGESTPKRDPAAAKRTRDRFMAELDHLNLGAPAPTSISSRLGLIFMSWVSGLNQPKENIAMSFKQRSTMTLVSSILVLVVFLFGSGGITAYAASAALPGDALYPVKTSLENARIGFAGGPEAQANLYLGFAGKRLDEIQALVAEGRYSNIDATANQFQSDLRKALDAIQVLSRTDPARAAQLSASVAKILQGYTDSLSTLLAGVPADVQPVIQGALNATQSAEAGNSNDDNSNANINDDNGNGAGDNSNGNVNDDNSNANINDDNGNGNGNANDDNSNANINDDNSNGNANDDNSNGNANDDNSNGNANDDNSNGNVNDDNSNANINDDNGNANDDNSNANINDDNSNSNANSNSNGNDNGGSGGSNDNGGSGGGGNDNGGSGGGGNDNGGSGGGGNDNGGGSGGGGNDNGNGNGG